MITRRPFVLVPTAAAAMLVGHRRAYGEPVTTVMIIGSIVQALVTLYTHSSGLAAERERTIEQERARLSTVAREDAIRVAEERRLVRSELARLGEERLRIALDSTSAWLNTAVSAKHISFQAATDIQRNSLAHFLMAGDLDGHGTSVAVNQGVLELVRGRSGGKVHNAHASLIAMRQQHGQEDAALLVPTTGIIDIGSRNRNAVIKRVADTMKVSDTDFNATHAVGTARFFSTAARPQGLHDTEVYEVFLKKQLEQQARALEPIFVPVKVKA
jgi:hypothetical protein